VSSRSTNRLPASLSDPKLHFRHSTAGRKARSATLLLGSTPSTHAKVHSAAHHLLSLRQRVRELEARLGRNSSNSSRPPSSDPPQAPARPKAPPSGRKRGGQPGHRGAYRALLSVEQVDELVVVEPERCRHCGQPFSGTATGRRGRAWRHQVVELLPLAVRVT
jgi:transposase